MLYYVKINDFKGLEHSGGQGCTRDTKLESGQCGSCIFYIYRKVNFHYERYICNGCYHCLQYEKTSKRALFRVISTKKELLEPFAGEPLSKERSIKRITFQKYFHIIKKSLQLDANMLY